MMYILHYFEAAYRPQEEKIYSNNLLYSVLEGKRETSDM